MFTTAWFSCMVLSVSAFVLGLRCISQEDKILGRLREWVLSKKTVDTMQEKTSVSGTLTFIEKSTIQVPRVPGWLHKPLLTCVTCMPSVWGLIITSLASYLFFNMALQGPTDYLKYAVSIIFISVSSSFITELMWSLKEKIQSE